MPKYEVGTVLRDFTFTKVVPIEELQMVLYELQHNVTHARVIHLKVDDPENLFCLLFRTLPTNSTGIAHILEHTVLCGSKKYPVKDPFFSMTLRSLHTFMNAMTGSDFTCYPAASQVEKDFYNLLEVYLDAVFFPKLEEYSFLQEGCHVEFKVPDDPQTPLLFKGVVFNEMKGALSPPETRLWQEIMQALVPDLPYAFNSGGDPKEIPKLTHKELQAFHQIYYHPSHCLFFFYGNLPLDLHLEFITKRVFKGCKKIQDLPPTTLQPRFDTPRTLTRHFPPQHAHDKEFVALSWLTTELKNQEDVLSLSILDSILMETDASPLKFALLQSKLCTQADGYLELETSELPYTIICRGCKKESSAEIENLILNTLRDIVKRGLDPALVKAAMHQMEFNRLEITGNHGPFGLTLFFRSALSALHGCPAENALRVYSHFQKLHLLVKNPKYLPQLIRKYLLNNPHRITLRFTPDPSLQKEEEKKEREELEKIKKNLSPNEQVQIITQTANLKKFQEKIETHSLECLPKITLNDIPQETVDFHLNYEQANQLTIFHHDCFTNHIIFANIIFDLPYIALKDLPYVKLLLAILPEIGAGGRDYKKNLVYINTYLGSFSTILTLFPQVQDPTLLNPVFGFQGKALTRNVGKLFSLFKDVFYSLELDNAKRIKELILQIHTALENRLNHNAMSYAIQLAVSPFTHPSFIESHWSGLKYLHFIRSLTQDLDKKLPEIIEKLKTLKKTLFHFTNPHLILSCDAQQYRTLEKEKFYDIGNLPISPYNLWKNHNLPPLILEQARPISSPVAFSALGFHTKTTLHPTSPALSLSTELLKNIHLHKKIREQGGAYGAGASYNPITGNYYFYSYRDPHILKTFQAFDESIAMIENDAFSDNDLVEAKLCTIQNMDFPISPGSRAMYAYRHFREGFHKDMRQSYRNILINTQKKEIKDAILEELIKKKEFSSKVTFTSESHLKKDGVNLPIISLDEL